MNFALKFSISYDDLEEMEAGHIPSSENKTANQDGAANKAGVDLSAKVISLDDFRKNRNNNPGSHS
jgi:hypothetical protein